MTSREFFIVTLKDELPRFDRVYKSVPETALDYRPHEKSRTARELLATITDEAGMIASIVKSGELDMTGYTTGEYKNTSDALSALTRGFQEAGTAAEAVSDQDWDGQARLLMGGQSAWETTRGQMAWGVLLDLIHHRGQLSVYLRPMGGRVPAIYGPSADAND